MKKSIVVLTSLIFAALLFSGCQDVIFAKIMGEVELEEGTINGHINSIVRFGNEIFTQNGRIYAKPADNNSHGAWSERMGGIDALSYDYYGGGFSGVYVNQLAADSTALYALALGAGERRDEGANYVGTRLLYRSSDGRSWTQVGDVTGASGDTVIFCTNAIKNENRKAFIRYNGNVYELSASWSPTSPGTAMTDNGAEGSSTAAALWYNGHANFFDTTAVATNETGARQTPTYIYRGNGATLEYAAVNGSGSSSTLTWMSAGSAGAAILSITVTSDAIILGTDGNGLNKVALDGDGKPIGDITSNFSTNADSALESPYRIFALLCVDPSRNETGASIYASVDFTGSSSSSGGSYKDIGLWSYYAGRGNWNRE